MRPPRAPCAATESTTLSAAAQGRSARGHYLRLTCRLVEPPFGHRRPAAAPPKSSACPPASPSSWTAANPLRAHPVGVERRAPRFPHVAREGGRPEHADELRLDLDATPGATVTVVQALGG